MNKLHDKQKNKAVLLLLLVFATAALFIVALCVGRYYVPIEDIARILISPDVPDGISPAAAAVVLDVRLPRLLANVLVGAALSLSGAVYQSMFKNPLVSGDILGVSGGAAVGAALGIILGISGFALQMAAFIAGLIAVLLVTLIARLFPSRSSLVLVLSGIIVGGFASSVLALMKYLADVHTKLPEIVFWLMGSMASIKMFDLLIYAPAILICSALVIAAGWRLNILALGDTDARSLGVDIKKMRLFFVSCATILTACCVSLCGIIGWFSLVIPHLGRLIAGNDNRWLLPISALFGALFIIVMDTAARTLTGGEIPLGILTGIVGTPVFAYILINRRKSVA